jgi:hypothetical protein
MAYINILTGFPPDATPRNSNYSVDMGGVAAKLIYMTISVLMEGCALIHA